MTYFWSKFSAVKAYHLSQLQRFPNSVRRSTQAETSHFCLWLRAGAETHALCAKTILPTTLCSFHHKENFAVQQIQTRLNNQTLVTFFFSA